LQGKFGEKVMKNLLVGFLAIIFIGLSIQAQSSSVRGETYADEEHGYSFTAPTNWSAEKSQGECAGIILSNPAETIDIVVKPHHSNSLANFYKDESNFSKQSLKQVSGIKDLADGMKYVRFSKQNILLDVIFIPFSSQSGAVVMNFSNDENTAIEAMKHSVNIIKSMRFSASQTGGETQSGVASPSNSNSFFAGKRLYRETGSSQFEIILCPSGGYQYNYNGFFAGGTSTSEENGRWQIANSGGVDYLVLDSNRGERTTFSISQIQGSSVRLNGNIYSVSQYGCR
jgi:hypothetical protein